MVDFGRKSIGGRARYIRCKSRNFIEILYYIPDFRNLSLAEKTDENPTLDKKTFIMDNYLNRCQPEEINIYKFDSDLRSSPKSLIIIFGSAKMDNGINFFEIYQYNRF